MAPKHYLIEPRPFAYCAAIITNKVTDLCSLNDLPGLEPGPAGGSHLDLRPQGSLVPVQYSSVHAMSLSLSLSLLLSISPSVSPIY